VQLHGVVRVSVVRTGRLMYLGGLERGELGRAQWASSGTDAVPSPVRRPSRSRVEKLGEGRIRESHRCDARCALGRPRRDHTAGSPGFGPAPKPHHVRGVVPTDSGSVVPSVLRHSSLLIGDGVHIEEVANSLGENRRPFHATVTTGCGRHGMRPVLAAEGRAHGTTTRRREKPSVTAHSGDPSPADRGRSPSRRVHRPPLPMQNPSSMVVEAMGLEPTNLLHAMQALYQLSYAPGTTGSRYQPGRANRPRDRPPSPPRPHPGHSPRPTVAP